MHHFDSKPLPYTCTQLFAQVADIERYPAFHEMTIDWHFKSLPENHCEVSVEITLLLQPGLLTYPLEKRLGQSSSQLLRLFENRARSLYSRA